MISLDNFITQLIHSGLAESFLNVIKEHYLKVTLIYDIICGIETEAIENISCEAGDEDSLTVTVSLNRKVTDEFCSYNNDFDVQILNCGNSISITVSNKLGNEDDIYEARLAGRKKANHNKWS